MTGRERYLVVLSNKKPDRLPCQVHSWMEYYLKTYLNGVDQYQAYAYFGMDPVIYAGPEYIYNQKDLKNWTERYIGHGTTADGDHPWQRIITTPEGSLTIKGVFNQYTGWITEFPIKNEKDFELSEP